MDGWMDAGSFTVIYIKAGVHDKNTKREGV